MKTQKSLYSRLALITSVTLVVGYFVVYAVYENINSEEVASNATITSTLMGKIKNNLDTLNTQVTDLTATVVASSIWSKVGSDINYTAGKVGVGATTGNAELDIQSGIKPHWGIYHDSTTEELRFWNGDNRVVIGSTGNVGIGTGSPSARLDTRIQTTQNIAGTVASSYPIASFLNESSDSSGIRGLEIGAPTSGIVSPVYLKVSGTSSRFSLLNQSNIENFTVLDNGNVGIGTASPSDKFEVNGNIKAGSIVTNKIQLYLTNDNWNYFGTQLTTNTPTKVELVVGHNSYGIFIDLFKDSYAWNIAEGTIQDVRIGSLGEYGISIKRVRKPGPLASQAGWDWYVKRTDSVETSILVHKITGGWTWDTSNTITPN